MVKAKVSSDQKFKPIQPYNSGYEAKSSTEVGELSTRWPDLLLTDIPTTMLPLETASYT